MFSYSSQSDRGRSFESRETPVGSDTKPEPRPSQIEWRRVSGMHLLSRVQVKSRFSITHVLIKVPYRLFKCVKCLVVIRRIRSNVCGIVI